MTQQTERERLADDLERLAIGGDNETKLCMRKAAALLRSDEPAKPDRYLQVWREANAAYWSDMHQEPTVRESDQAAAAVLRRNFPEQIGDEQIKRMADRFLGWPLPDNFNPDNGISVQRPSYGPKVAWRPIGTNLLNATQAEAMVRFILADQKGDA